MSALDSVRRFRQGRWWVLLVRPLLFLVVSLLVARLLVSLVGSVDWQQVATALGRLDWAQAPLLLALLLVRQAFNSVPLAVFVPGLGFWRGFQNDLTANLVGTVAPPPGDIVVRVSMFRSWGITPVDGMPGVTLNSLAFYVIRFSIPILGVVLLVGEDLSATQIWLAVLSLVVAAVIVVTLVLVARGEGFARLVGRRAALVVARFREGVDAESWEEAVTGFRARMSTRLVRGLPPSLAALAAMVVTDGAIVLVSLRLVGVDASLLPTAIVLGSFFVAYPLTALPLRRPRRPRRGAHRRLHRDSRARGGAGDRGGAGRVACRHLDRDSPAGRAHVRLVALADRGERLPSADAPPQERT